MGGQGLSAPSSARVFMVHLKNTGILQNWIFLTRAQIRFHDLRSSLNYRMEKSQSVPGLEDLPPECTYKKRKKRILMCFHTRARIFLTIMSTLNLKLTPFFRNFARGIQPNIDAEDPMKDLVPKHLFLDLP